MDALQECPKCGTAMSEFPLTAADGTALGFAGTGQSGSLISMVCPSCGHAELRAGPSEASMQDEASPAPPASAEQTAQAQLDEVAAALGVSPAELTGTRGTGPAFAALASRGLLGGAEPLDPGAGKLIALAVSAAIMTAGVVWLYMASGPVMEAGGFVATGGPYVIEHPAEDWIWLPTMGATFMTFAAVTNALISRGLNRPGLILPFWAGLFGSLAIPFFNYGFHAPGGGVSWAWIVCGVVFALMALPAILVLLLPSSWRGFRGAFGVADAVGVAVGLAGGLWVWSLVA